jgi:hypothetical protein
MGDVSARKFYYTFPKHTRQNDVNKLIFFVFPIP